jgi:hypothetical protein
VHVPGIDELSVATCQWDFNYFDITLNGDRGYYSRDKAYAVGYATVSWCVWVCAAHGRAAAVTSCTHRSLTPANQNLTPHHMLVSAAAARLVCHPRHPTCPNHKTKQNSAFNDAAHFCGDIPKDMVLSGDGLVFAVPSKTVSCCEADACMQQRVCTSSLAA